MSSNPNICFLKKRTISSRIRRQFHSLFSAKPVNERIIYVSTTVDGASAHREDPPTESTPAVDQYHNTVLPFLSILRVMGVFPFQNMASGAKKFRHCSVAMVYAIAIRLVLCIFAIKNVSILMNTMLIDQINFSNYMFSGMFLIYLSQHGFIPAVHWRDTLGIALYCNDWSGFQERFLQVTGKPLVLRFTNQVRTQLGFTFFTTLASSIILPHPLMVLLNIPFYYMVALVQLLAMLWYINCQVLIRTGLHFAQCLGEALRGDADATTVAKLRALWLELGRLAEQLGRAHATTYLHLIFFMFMTCIVGVFCVLQNSATINAEYAKSQLCVLVVATHSSTVLFILCSAGHDVVDKLLNPVKQILLTNFASKFDCEKQKEVDLFLTTLSLGAPAVTLNGYVDVNRRLWTSLLLTMASYLIVLLQLQLSIPGMFTKGNSTKPE